jgi:hypothetical protein
MMLQMRPGCECCDKDLPADVAGAMICSFECTFCADCAADVLKGACPNCGGGLVARPTRATALLLKYPAVSERTLKAEGCPAAA